MTIELPFDVGDKVYRLYGEKIVYSVIESIDVDRLLSSDGSVEQKVRYYVRNLVDGNYTSWVTADKIASSQSDLFNKIRLTGPEHDEDIWTQFAGQL